MVKKQHSNFEELRSTFLLLVPLQKFHESWEVTLQIGYRHLAAHILYGPFDYDIDIFI